MANTIDKVTRVDGSRKLVVDVYIQGDGSGDESDTVLIDASGYSPAVTDIGVDFIEANLQGFSAKLAFDASSNVNMCVLREGANVTRERSGRLVNTAGAGKTGDILISTNGLGSGDFGHITMNMTKREYAS